MGIEYYALVELKGSKYYGALAMLNVWNPRETKLDNYQIILTNRTTIRKARYHFLEHLEDLLWP